VVRLYCLGLAVGYDTLFKFSTLCGVWEFYGGDFIEYYPLGSDIVGFCNWVFFFLEGHFACFFRVEEILVIPFAFMIQSMCLDLLERVLVFCSWMRCSIVGVVFIPNSLYQVTDRNMSEDGGSIFLWNIVRNFVITTALNIYIPLILEICIMFWPVFF